MQFLDWIRMLNRTGPVGVQQWVKTFVRSRGYGPWYQRAAWESIRRQQATGSYPFPGLYDQLDKRWPSVLVARPD